MIPPHDDNGNLPPGEHPASIAEVVERFRGAVILSRGKKIESIKELFNFVQEFAVRLYIDGSFVTTRLSPNDVDVMVVVPEDFDFESYEGKHLLRMRRNMKLNHLDIWPYAENRHSDKISELLDVWTHDFDNDNVEKGIIRVEIADDQE